jgi:hypothetical protein
MKQGFYAFWIALFCVIVFILQSIIPGFTDLFVLNQKALDGEIWRFVSSIFLHGDLSHLAFNMFALLFFGFILEKTIGTKRFLISFLVSGVIANIISINYYNSSLGASGAIYGILGVLTILRPMMMVWAFGLLMPMFVASIMWVIADVLRMQGVFGITNVGSIAHISGIAVGIIFGIYFLINRKRIKKFSNNNLEVRFNKQFIESWEDHNLGK